MSKPLSALSTFAGSAPPWSLANLDGNFSTISGAIDDLGTYSNPLNDTSGSANQITVTSAAGLTATLNFGLLLYVKIANTTTSSTVTLNLNGLGSKTVLLPNGSAPVVGSMVANGVYGFFYDGTNFQLQGIVPISFDSSGNATFEGNVTIPGTLGVTGVVTGGTYNGQTISSSAQFTGTLAVGGSASAGHVLTIVGSIGVFTNIDFYSGGGYLEYVGTPAIGILSATAPTVKDDGGTFQVIGYRGTPVNVQSGSYALLLSDRGKSVQISVGNTVTVNTGIFSLGDAVVIQTNATSGNVTIAQGSGFTIYWANGTGVTTGNRTLAAIGMATLIFQGGNSAFITGSSLS